jgi:hypothetical protein
VGHPFICDNPQVFLTFLQVDREKFLVTAHNPTDTTVKTVLRRSPPFDLVSGDPVAVEIPAGDTVLVPCELQR